MESQGTNFNYDLGSLILSDSNPLQKDFTQMNDEFDSHYQHLSKENIKRFLQTLYTLKNLKEQEEEAIPDEHRVIDYSSNLDEVNLPDAVTAFPRHKKIPEKKPMTRWEKFAKDKGIRKQKRGRMVYDEITKSWVPRYGKDSIKKIQDKTDVIREVKPGQDPYEDPFVKKKLEKKMAAEKQKYQEMRNKVESKGFKMSDFKGQNQDQGLTPAQRKKKEKKARGELLRTAQLSTASRGLYDRKAHKEEPEVRKKTRNAAPTFKSSKDENKRNLDVLDYVEKTGGSKKVKK